MKDLRKKVKLIAVLLILILLAIIVLVFQYFRSGNENESTFDGGIVDNNKFVSEASLPLQIGEQLQIVAISPTPPVFESMWDTEPIFVTFNQPVNSDNITVKIVPNIRFRVETDLYDDRVLRIWSPDGWREGQQYVFSILSALEPENTGLRFTLTRQVPPLEDIHADDNESIEEGGLEDEGIFIEMLDQNQQ